MSYRVVNLGDIHFQSADDWAADKGELLGRAISTALEGIGQVIILINGDLAYSGAADQFEVAGRFVADLRASLSSCCGDLPVTILCTPGNHDCDFSGDQSARNILLQKLNDRRPQSSIESMVLTPLENYFNFVDSTALLNGINKTSPYKMARRFDGDGQPLEIVLLNSSWMSSRHERPGSLLYPREELERHQEDVTRIVVMHHPANWFKQPETMRDLVRWIGANADICLSGHEHVAETSVRLNERLRGVVYQQGGVFQEHPTDASGRFQVIDIDTGTGWLQLRSYKWQESHFSLSGDVEKVNFASLTSRTSKTRLKDKFIEHLDDPQFPGTLGRSETRLKDVFVYPDSIEYSSDEEASRRRVPGAQLADYLLTHKRVLLSGADRCGKTSLAKQLTLECHARGKVPVLLTAQRLARAMKKHGSIEREVRRELRHQYENMSLELLAQTFSSETVAIVDDLDDAFGERVTVVQLATALATLFPHQILIGSDELAVLETQGELGEAVGLPGYKRLKICDLGHEKIQELTSRWVRVHGEESAVGRANIDAIAKIVSQVLSTDFIPHHPWIVLVLLYKSVSDEPMAVSDGSYGHLYQAILTTAMSTERRSGLDLNGKYTYLSLLAHHLFSEQSPNLSNSEMREFHAGYCEAYDVAIDFEAALGGLVACGVLRRDESGISFVARYSYCFFLAYYFKSRIQDAGTRSEVENLLRHLYHRESADILLFLSHLAPGTWALDVMLARARELFADSPLWNLKEDAAAILKLSDGRSQEVALPDSTPAENRAIELAAADERRQDLVDADDFDGRSLQVVPSAAPVDDWDETVQEVQSAYKMIRILGQVLKSSVLSAEAGVKQAIVSEVFRLSRRMLGDAFSQLGDEIDERRDLALRHIEMIQVESNKTPDRNAMIVRADREVIGICSLASFAVVRSVAEAVGAHNLQRTYNRVIVDDPAIPNRLYEMTILMENDVDFPVRKIEQLSRDLRGNWFGHSLLQSLVAYHFYLYDRDYKLRQSVLNKLGIKTRSVGRREEQQRKPPKLIGYTRAGKSPRKR